MNRTDFEHVDMSRASSMTSWNLSAFFRRNEFLDEDVQSVRDNTCYSRISASRESIASDSSHRHPTSVPPGNSDFVQERAKDRHNVSVPRSHKNSIFRNLNDSSWSTVSTSTRLSTSSFHNSQFLSVPNSSRPAINPSGDRRVGQQDIPSGCRIREDVQPISKIAPRPVLQDADIPAVQVLPSASSLSSLNSVDMTDVQRRFDALVRAPQQQPSQATASPGRNAVQPPPPVNDVTHFSNSSYIDRASRGAPVRSGTNLTPEDTAHPLHNTRTRARILLNTVVALLRQGCSADHAELSPSLVSRICTRYITKLEEMLMLTIDHQELAYETSQITEAIEHVSNLLFRVSPKPAPVAAPPSPAPLSSSPPVSPSVTGNPVKLLGLKIQLVGLVRRLHADNLPCINNPGLSSAQIKDIYDLNLPATRQVIQDVNTILDRYTNLDGYEVDISEIAYNAVSTAYDWCEEVTKKYQEARAHLATNAGATEMRVKIFKPNDSIPIYEFIAIFEEYAETQLPNDAWANHLYHRHLDQFITTTYPDIGKYENDYTGLKLWLFNRFGDLKVIFNDAIKAISALKVPTSTDVTGQIAHCRSIFSILSNLTKLEVSKGVPVPRLDSYLGANTFLTSVVEKLPEKVRTTFFERQAEKGLINSSSVEGREYLDIIIDFLWRQYTLLEVTQNYSGNPPESQSAPKEQKRSRGNRSSDSNQRPAFSLNPIQQPTQSQSSPPPQPQQQTPQQPKQASNNSTSNGNSGSQSGNPQQNSRSQDRNKSRPGGKQFAAWTCPLKNHEDHPIIACREFFEMPAGDRRVNTRACFTCLDKNRQCYRGSCGRIENVPAELICSECAKTVSSEKSPPNLLYCGRQNHAKPADSDLIMSLEAWIPDLVVKDLTPKIQTHLTFFNAYNTCSGTLNPEDIIQACRTTKTVVDPDNKLSGVVFDTASGEHRPIKPSDKVVEQSSETAFYTLQTLKLGDYQVLTFFDSGSNGNIIQGDLAEKLKLQVLTEHGVDLGGFGGIKVWSDFGCYLLSLGPSTNNEIFTLEVQGVDTITERVPSVDLTKLWPEAKTVLSSSTKLPSFIGGCRVSLLIGIKSSPLGPKLLYTLPNGLSIFKSSFLDIYGSDICFGGPHAVFTEAYSRLGRNVNHLQIFLSELASSYARSPVVFLKADIDEHGPEPQKTSVEEFIDPLLKPSAPEEEDDPIPCELSSFKSLVPLSKLKGLQDELDIPVMGDFKCDDCANCKACKMSTRAKTKSLQEIYEQDIIKKSIRVDLQEKRVYASLPFIQDPVAFMTKRHSGPSNKHQALKIYQAQCRKPEAVKDQVKATVKDLMSHGFMVKMADLPKQTQDSINSAPFHHFYPWRAVYKTDSVSTPVRVVVNPTITGLNEILAKGTNMLLSIPEVIVRFRSHQFAWNTDVSKMYNQLFLEPNSLPYSLFLFSDQLDPLKPPDIYVMLRAWYGVSSTGNQASFAIEHLATEFKDEFPLAFDLLVKSRYVDDVLGGASTKELREKQILQTQECLAKGGFSMKYVARGGEPPPKKASSDGIHVGCLGLKWNTLEDTLSPGYDESFFIKKAKGQKTVANLDLSKPENLKKALENDWITRVAILSRVAEFYDPCGLWEPVKVQLKLSLSLLNKLDWSDPVPVDQRETWLKHFELMNETRKDSLPRYLFPELDRPPDQVRLLCLSDAASEVAGTAIYAGIPKSDGRYSCQLVMSKSRLVKGTIPRNELEGVLLTAETVQFVSSALSDFTVDTLLFSDSNVAICWVLNGRKRLRAWVFNRVNSILSLLHVKPGSGEPIPLYHIQGCVNLADLVTKPRNLLWSEYTGESEWQRGKPWMHTATDQLPQVQPVSVEESAVSDFNKELFQEVELNLLEDRKVLQLTQAPLLVTKINDSSQLAQNWLMDSVNFKHLGWTRARNRVIGLAKAKWAFLHLIHKKFSRHYHACVFCRPSSGQAVKDADNLIAEAASFQAEKSLGAKYLSSRFFKQGRVWYSSYRLSKEDPVDTVDLEQLPFVDKSSIKKILPIVLVGSTLFQSLLAHIHFKEMPHSGVENTLKRILERMHPVGLARQRIANFKAACSKCRLMLKKTVETELADFITARTCLAPPFWHSQIDIAMGFKARETDVSSDTFPCYALVICCLLTSATNILVLPNLTTEGVVMAIERHASRYGLPGKLFIDRGRQLEKLKDCRFSFTNVLRHFSDDQKFEIIPSTPKAHHQHGRVERKVAALRSMLEKLSLTEDKTVSLLAWETTFAKIADSIDNLPIGRGSASASSDLGWEIITPNRLKLGRNSFRQLEGDIVLTNSPQSILERNQLISATWYQLFLDRIHLLIPPPEHLDDRQPRIGDVCLFVHEDPNFKRLWTWRLGIIQAQLSRTSFEIRYCIPGTDRVRTIVRATRQISVIVPVDELDCGITESGRQSAETVSDTTRQ